MKTKRKIDLSYLKQNFYNKPKQIHQDIAKNLVKRLSKFKILKHPTLVDHGCADGQFLNVLSKEKSFNNFNLIGTDVHFSLLAKAKKQLKNRIKIKKGSITNRNLFQKKTIDISCVCGVLPLFEDLKIIDNCINWSKSKGIIFVTALFNNYDYDVFVKYNPSTHKNITSVKKLSGWNIFSKRTVSRFLDANKKVKNYKFIRFEMKKNIKPNKKMPYKLWTLKTKENKNICVNGLSLVLNQEFLIINIK